MENKSEEKSKKWTEKMLTHTYDETVASVISEKYGSIKNGVKILARHAQSSLSSARYWIYGSGIPTGVHLLNIMAECDELHEQFRRLVDERRVALGKTPINPPERSK